MNSQYHLTQRRGAFVIERERFEIKSGGKFRAFTARRFRADDDNAHSEAVRSCIRANRRLKARRDQFATNK